MNKELRCDFDITPAKPPKRRGDSFVVTVLRHRYDLEMRLRGQIRNGKIVLEGHDVLPEGAEVVVEVRESAASEHDKGNVQFPLFHSKNPGSLDLSNQRIAEILEDEELSAGH